MSGRTKAIAAKEDAAPALVPKLRFPDFRDADGWKCESMDEIYSFKGNNSLSRDKLNYLAGSVKNIHYGDIHTKFSTHFDIIKESVPFINDSELGSIRDENYCTEGDIVFADASEDLEDIGKSIEIVNLNNERVVSGTHTILARQTGDHLVLGFGGHLFKSGWVRAQIQKESQGSKVLGISPTRLRNTLSPFPPDKKEQKKIADCLSSVDELIVALARKLGALKTHKKGLMQQLFPREGETQPRLRFPEFRDVAGWEAKTLKDISTINQGLQIPISKRFTEQVESSYFYITNEFLRENSKSTYYIKNPQPSVICNENDILMTRTGNTGQVVTNVSGAFHNNFFKIKYSSKVDKNFYIYFLRSENTQRIILSLAGTSTIPDLNHGDFYKIEIAIPPTLAEQQRIADCLTSLDDLIAAQTQKLEALKTHKKALMQQLFPSPEVAI